MRNVAALSTITFGICLAVLTGCGDDGNPDDPGLTEGEAGVRAVVGTISTALAAGDGPRVCSLLDPPAQQLLMNHTHKSDCLSAAAAWPTANPGASMPNTDGLDIQVTGDSASARNSIAADTPPFTRQGTWSLKRTESRWNVVAPQ